MLNRSAIVLNVFGSSEREKIIVRVMIVVISLRLIPYVIDYHYKLFVINIILKKLIKNPNHLL